MTLEESISSIRDIHETNRHIQRLATLWNFGTNKKHDLQKNPMVQKQKHQKSSKNIPWTACLMEAYPNVTRHCTKKSDPSRFTGEVLVPLCTLLKLVVRKTKEESNAITYNQNAIKIHMLYICIYVYSGQSYLSNNNTKNRNTEYWKTWTLQTPVMWWPSALWHLLCIELSQPCGPNPWAK